MSLLVVLALQTTEPATARAKPRWGTHSSRRGKERQSLSRGKCAEYETETQVLKKLSISTVHSVTILIWKKHFPITYFQQTFSNLALFFLGNK